MNTWSMVRRGGRSFLLPLDNNEMKDHRPSEQSMQDGFLHVHPIFGLVEDDRLRAVENVGGNFQSPVRRKTVHKDSVRRGKGHQFRIDLVWLEHRVAHVPFGLKTHARPGI